MYSFEKVVVWKEINLEGEKKNLFDVLKKNSFVFNETLKDIFHHLPKEKIINEGKVFFGKFSVRDLSFEFGSSDENIKLMIKTLGLKFCRYQYLGQICDGIKDNDEGNFYIFTEKTFFDSNAIESRFMLSIKNGTKNLRIEPSSKNCFLSPEDVLILEIPNEFFEKK